MDGVIAWADLMMRLGAFCLLDLVSVSVLGR